MRIIISPRAEKELKKIPKLDQIAVARKIRLLKESREAAKEEKLKGYANIFRVRVCDYRILYKRNTQEIYIILIRQRKEVYNLPKQLFG